MRGNVNRDLRRERLRRRRGWAQQQPPRSVAEGNRGNLLHARKRDDDERNKQKRAEPERERRAGNEVVSLPEGKDGGEPGADHVGGGGQHDGLPDAGTEEDRQRKQYADQDGDDGDL